MARTPRTPQEKKRLSLQKDRRNTYGENDKASRKAIPRNKALAHRAVRRAGHEAEQTLARLEEEQAELVQSTLTTARLQKGDWRKCPDSPLGEVIARQQARRRKAADKTEA